jgi:hypothetical protein
MSAGSLLARSLAIRYGKSHNKTTTVDVPRLQICQRLYASSLATL